MSGASALFSPGSFVLSSARAVAGGGLRSDNAVAEARATTDRGIVRADAESADRYDRVRAEIVEQATAAATIGEAHVATGAGFHITPPPVSAAPASLTIQGRRFGLFSFDLSLVNDPSSFGQISYQAILDMSFDQSRGLPANFVFDFTSFNVIGAGFDSLKVTFDTGNGPIGPPAFTDPASAAAFLSAPLNLGPVTTNLFGQFRPKVTFDVLFTSGGIASAGAGEGDPLPGTLGNGFSLSSITPGPMLPPDFVADVDFDNDVDGDDFLLLQRTGPSLIGQWAQDFGADVSFTSVPEPHTVGLLLIGVAAAQGGFRRAPNWPA